MRSVPVRYSREQDAQAHSNGRACRNPEAEGSHDETYVTGKRRPATRNTSDEGDGGAAMATG